MDKKAIENRICELTGLTPDGYAHAVWHGAHDYVQWFGQENQLLANGLMLTRSFWRWWTAEWRKTDELFIVEYSRYGGLNEQKFLLDLYHQAHQPESVISYPDVDMVTEAMRRRD